MRNKRNEKGITLVALVVTIVILLILAGVSITMVLGNNGIVTKAKEASVKQTHAQVISAVEMQYAEYETELATETLEGESFEDYLDSKNYLKDNGDIDVVALIGGKTTLGNGTGETDAYFIWRDNEGTKYSLSYEDKQGNVEELWEAKISYNTSDDDSEDEGTISDPYFIAAKQGTIIGLTDEGKKQTTLVVPTQISGVNITAINTGIGFGNSTNYDYNRVLTSVTIPNTVTSLSGSSLSFCSNLTDVIFQGTMEEWKKFGITYIPYSSKLKTIQCTDGEVSL